MSYNHDDDIRFYCPTCDTDVTANKGLECPNDHQDGDETALAMSPAALDASIANLHGWHTTIGTDLDGVHGYGLTATRGDDTITARYCRASNGVVSGLWNDGTTERSFARYDRHSTPRQRLIDLLTDAN